MEKGLFYMLVVGIKICTFPYVHPYVQPKILCAQLLNPLMDFVHTIHSDQHDMKMTVKIGFCDAASFT